MFLTIHSPTNFSKHSIFFARFPFGDIYIYIFFFLVTEMAVISNNKRNNRNNRSSGINDGAQRTLATTLVVAKRLLENSLKRACKQGF